MGVEIERKFLVHGEGWRGSGRAKSIRQGYLCLGPQVAVRVRIAGDEANLNIKGATVEITRAEFEFPIPREEAETILATLCVGTPIEKTRHLVSHAGMQWEVDEFHGANAGLVVAELELEAEDQAFEKPPWLGEEVSHEPRYLNSHLTRHPYSMW